jgi:hypothetical protein
MDDRRMKAILLFAAALAFASAPFWSDGFGGFDPNRYPDPQVNPPVQPAGYAFAIWGPIYLWLLAHAAFGLFSRADDAGWDATRWPLFLSLAVGASWISVAQRSPVMATVLIWIMLAGALAALLRAPRGDRWLLAGPVGLYAGWLTAASFVALGLLGGGYDILLPDAGWAWVALLAALVTVTAVQSRVPHAPEYGLAAAWAFAAVGVANWGQSVLLVAAALLAAAGAAAYALALGRAGARRA